MRRSLLALIAVCATALSCAPSAPPPTKVTYIANEGFLIEVGSSKILIDAIFDDETINYAHIPDPRTLERLENATEPFDGADLILVTHGHRDHFAAAPVLRHLAANPDAVLIAPPQAVEQLAAHHPALEEFGDRIREISLDPLDSVELSVRDIRLEIHRLHHSPYIVTDEETGETYNRHADVENLAYLIEVDGVGLFHVGDAVLSQHPDYFTEARFSEGQVDIAFLEFFDWSDETKALLRERLSPAHVVFMHLPPQPEQITKLTRHLGEQFPNAVVFQEPLETRSFTRPPASRPR